MEKNYEKVMETIEKFGKAAPVVAIAAIGAMLLKVCVDATVKIVTGEDLKTEQLFEEE